MAILAHHIIGYENILRPNLDFLMANSIITNDRGGGTFLYMFTNLSNIFVDLYAIFYGVGLLGSKKLYSLTHKDGLRGAITLYIAITGIIYCAVLMPFQKSATFPLFPYPMDSVMWFSNVVNVWCHVFVPFTFTAFWFVPLCKEPLPKVKSSLCYLSFPLVYFIFSIIRGKIVNWYPYPFLSSTQLWNMLFKNREYAPVPAVLLLVVVFTVLCGIFFAVGIGLNAIHNKMVSRKKQTAEVR